MITEKIQQEEIAKRPTFLIKIIQGLILLSEVNLVLSIAVSIYKWDFQSIWFSASVLLTLLFIVLGTQVYVQKITSTSDGDGFDEIVDRTIYDKDSKQSTRTITVEPKH